MAPYTADLVFWKKRPFQDVDKFEEEPLPVKVTYFEGDAEFDVDEKLYMDDHRDALNSTDKNEDLEDASSRLAYTGVEEVDGKKRKQWTISCLLILLFVGVALITAGIIIRQRNREKDRNKQETPTSPSFTEIPTIPPTNSPERQPSRPPSRAVTAAPQISSPSSGPERTSSPNFAPIIATTRIERFSQILGSVTNPTQFREGNPENMALEWLALEDGAELDPDTTDAREIQERYIAALLYFSTNGDEWTTDLNFLSETSICTWNFVSVGIICDSSGFVTGLSIVDNNLEGPLPSEINGLVSLERLNLYYNQLTGPIPELDQLSQLEYVDLDRNQLTGLLPQSIFNLPSLETLLLLNNRELTGKLPPLLPSSRLQKVSFYNCSLSGSLPASWGDVSSLTFLQFFDNELTGRIPSSLTSLPDLELFSLRGNKLTGTIPPFSGQRNLAIISLGENKLRGSLPTNLGELRGLETLYLQGNQLSGTIPTSMNNLPRLKQAWLFENSFQGPLPNFAGNPRSLQQLFLNDNQFTGTMDLLLQRAPTSIEYLDVSNNRALQGTLSSDISRMTSLISLNISHSALTGRLPEAVESLDLIVLSLQATGITGNLTKCLCTAQASFDILTADCGGNAPQIACSCCTECCTTIDSKSLCQSTSN